MLHSNSLGKRGVLKRFMLALTPIILVLSLTPMPDAFVIFGILLEIIVFLLIPGICCVEYFLRDLDWVQKIGLALLLGIIVQIINVFIIYSTISISLGTIHFSFWISLLTSLWVIVLSTLQAKKGKHTLLNMSASKPQLLFVIFLLALAVRLIFQNQSINPYTDGALYLSFARNILGGNFVANVAGPTLDTFTIGFVPHLSVPFILSVFFVWVQPSYIVGKLAVCLIGSFLVFPVFALAKELFNEKTGIIASIIVVFHPLLILYSSFLYGPEILSTLFTITCLLFFLLGIRKNWKYCIISGIFGFITFLTWYPNFYGLIIFIPLIYLLSQKRLLYRLTMSSIVVGIYFLIALRTTASFSLGAIWYLGVPLSLALFQIFNRQERKLHFPAFFLTLFIFFNLSFIRSFVNPEVYIIPTSSSPTVLSQYFLALSGKISVFSSTFVSLLSLYFNEILTVIAALSIVSLLRFSNFRWKLFFLVAPIIQLLIYVVFMPQDILYVLTQIEY